MMFLEATTTTPDFMLVIWLEEAPPRLAGLKVQIKGLTIIGVSSILIQDATCSKEVALSMVGAREDVVFLGQAGKLLIQSVVLLLACLFSRRQNHNANMLISFISSGEWSRRRNLP